MADTDAEFTTYVAECDDALRQEIARAGGVPSRLVLPLPRTPTQHRAMTGWLDALYREYQRQILIDCHDGKA